MLKFAKNEVIMIKLIFVFLLSLSLYGAEIGEWAGDFVRKWTPDFVFDKMQPLLKSAATNQPIAVRHVPIDKIHRLWTGELTEIVASKLNEKGYNAFRKEAIFCDTKPSYSEDGTLELTVVITSPQRANVLAFDCVQALKPFYVVVDFTEKLAAIAIQKSEEDDKANRAAIRAAKCRMQFAQSLPYVSQK